MDPMRRVERWQTTVDKSWRDGASDTRARGPSGGRTAVAVLLCATAAACSNDASNANGAALDFATPSAQGGQSASGGASGSSTVSPPSREDERDLALTGLAGSSGSSAAESTSTPSDGGAPEQPDAAAPITTEPDAGAPIACVVQPNTGAANDGDANIDLNTSLQRIAGFGGMDGGFYAELTPAQVDTAFGNGPGQLGLSIIRIRVPENPNNFGTSLAAASRAAELGALIMATPWTPPANLKSNNSTVGGSLNVASYAAYANHLLSFRDFMQANGAPLYALSVQNEPDIQVTYESCDWTPAQLVDWISAQGARFGDTRLIAAESFNFNRQVTDPILNNPAAANQVDIIAGHIYGNGLSDYPLARQRGKEVWMTEHYTDSGNEPDRANMWPLALDVGTELHNSMTANFSAYVWWAIRRGYGLMTEDGVVSKRGYLMAQYSKFIRPGFVRVGATQPNAANVAVTAYKGDNDRVVIVAVNRNAQAQTINLDLFNSCATAFTRFTTSVNKNVANDGEVVLTNQRASVTLDGQSVTTFVSQ